MLFEAVAEPEQPRVAGRVADPRTITVDGEQLSGQTAAA
jgi:hypothetical protein